MRLLQKRWYLTIVYLLFGIVPIFCFLLDLFLSVIITENKNWMNLDESFFNQTIYFTVWVSLLIAFWGICNALGLYIKTLPKWITGRHFQTLILVLSFLMFWIYVPTLIFGDVAGFDIWYKIIKSSLEHIIVPICLFIFYFLHPSDQQIDLKTYAKHTGWYNLIYPAIYVVFIFVRALMLHYFPNGNEPGHANSPLTPFPYIQIDFTSTPVWLICLFVVLFMGATYGLSVLATYLVKLRNANYYKSIDKKQYNVKQIAMEIQ